MAKPLDPRKVLKHISNPLLREFFTRRGELGDVAWDELSEHKIEPVFQAWQALPARQQLEVQVILRDVSELADPRGIGVLADEIHWRCPDRAGEFDAQEGHADKAMWVYLNVPAAFEQAALFARADALAAGRYWNRRNSLPKRKFTVDDAMCDKLAQALKSYYVPTQMRGRHCQVVHYQRSGGLEYFFAYLDDYPDKRLIFDGDDQAPILRSDRCAFENVFVYNGEDGSMELYALGGTKVWEPLQAAFCEAILDEEVDPADPLRPSFHLDHLLSPNFPLVTDPRDGVEEARITRLRLVPRGSGGYVEIKADPKAHRDDIYHKVDRWLNTQNIPAGSTRVTKTTFCMKFQPDERGRRATMTFDVAAPHSSNLRSKPDEQREVGERCLKLWKVVANDAE